MVRTQMAELSQMWSFGWLIISVWSRNLVPVQVPVLIGVHVPVKVQKQTQAHVVLLHARVTRAYARHRSIYYYQEVFCSCFFCYNLHNDCVSPK